MLGEAEELVTFAESLVGNRLGGKWNLERLLGVGRITAVFEAVDGHGRRVAIKCLHPQLSRVERMREVLFREAYAANQVGQPGAVIVHDDGYSAEAGAYLIMELVEGETLEQRVQRDWALSPLDALIVTEEILDSLEGAHRKGIVHLGLKPRNFIVDREGRVRILEFGMAPVRELASVLSTLPPGSLAPPAPEREAPERVSGRWDQVDARSDLWGVGATMFFMLTGQRALDTAATRVPTSERLSVLPYSPGLPAVIAQLVDRALAPDPRDRWPSAAAMRVSVREARGELDGDAEHDDLPTARPEALVPIGAQDSEARGSTSELPDVALAEASGEGGLLLLESPLTPPVAVSAGSRALIQDGRSAGNESVAVIADGPRAGTSSDREHESAAQEPTRDEPLPDVESSLREANGSAMPAAGSRGSVRVVAGPNTMEPREVPSSTAPGRASPGDAPAELIADSGLRVTLPSADSGPPGDTPRSGDVDAAPPSPESVSGSERVVLERVKSSPTVILQLDEEEQPPRDTRIPERPTTPAARARPLSPGNEGMWRSAAIVLASALVTLLLVTGLVRYFAPEVPVVERVRSGAAPAAPDSLVQDPELQRSSQGAPSAAQPRPVALESLPLLGESPGRSLRAQPTVGGSDGARRVAPAPAGTPSLTEDPRPEPPRTPEEGQPRTPEEGQPRTPEEGQPRTPEEGQPRTSEEGQPRTPEEGQPRTPEEGQPRTPEEAEPRTPEEGQPRAPAEAEPRTPEEGQPRTPEGTGPEPPKDSTRKLREAGQVETTTNLRDALSACFAHANDVCLELRGEAPPRSTRLPFLR